MSLSYVTMKKALEATNLYSFDDTNISHELNTYASFIDEISDELNESLRECFIQTAVSFGLDQREYIIGPKRTDISLSKRRNQLLKRESINSNSFTVQRFLDSLDSLGLNCELIEMPERFVLSIDATGSYSGAQKLWIRDQIKRLLPAHLDVQVMFNSLSWDTLDEKDLSFSSLDQKNETWDEIDNKER